ncbi:MAG: dihydroorotate dehydrogenase electron transfer subunit [bacterium]
MTTEVIENVRISGQYYRLTLACAEIANQASAGQFVMIRVHQGLDPLLRRPFSIHRLWDSRRHRPSPDSGSDRPQGIQILFRLAGKGTAYLASLSTGAKIDVIGPLGHGFQLEKPVLHPVLIAGGIGIAPLLFLADQLRVVSGQWPVVSKEKTGDRSQESGVRSQEKNKLQATSLMESPLFQPRLFLGGKSAEDILCQEDFRKQGFSLSISTEDGSLGHKGLITEPLCAYLEQVTRISSGIEPVLFACGPLPLMSRVIEIARHYHLSCQVSLEQRMACGVGACMGCVVELEEGDNSHQYRRVCTEGPVFEILIKN